MPIRQIIFSGEGVFFPSEKAMKGGMHYLSKATCTVVHKKPSDSVIITSSLRIHKILLGQAEASPTHTKSIDIYSMYMYIVSYPPTKSVWTNAHRRHVTEECVRAPHCT